MLSPFFEDIQANKAYVFRPYIRHLVGAHIEGQYQRLYSLYLEELLVHRKEDLRDDLSELREIASDIRDYSETLPSIKGQTALLSVILSTTSTVFAIVGINILGLGGIITSHTIMSVILVLAVIAFMVGVGYPFIVAFQLKRFLFKNYNSQGPTYFSFREANPAKSYDSSVYRLEDNHFELLGGKEQKRKEIPVDIFLRISILPLVAPFAIMGYKRRVKTGLV